MLRFVIGHSEDERYRSYPNQESHFASEATLQQQWQERHRQQPMTTSTSNNHRRSVLSGMSALLRTDVNTLQSPRNHTNNIYHNLSQTQVPNIQIPSTPSTFSPSSQQWYQHHPLHRRGMETSPVATHPTTTPNHRALSPNYNNQLCRSSVDGDISPPTSSKPSRYLREMDRRIILSRLARGEKQATLAKEYRVSRAAICSLNKHRMEVMSRADENPFANHPKKRKLRATVTSPTDEVEGMGGSVVVVYEVKSRAIQLLLTTLRDSNTPLEDFRNGSDRLMRLVLEEALSMVSTEAVQVGWKERDAVNGIRKTNPSLAISMEQMVHPMMDMFQSIEPNQPAGSLRTDEKNEENITLKTGDVPELLADHNVFVLDVVATYPERICALITKLKARGVVESRMYIVALFVSSEVVAMVQCKFPQVRLITTQIESSLNKWRRNTIEPVTAMEAMLVRWEQVYTSQSTRQ